MCPETTADGPLAAARELAPLAAELAERAEGERSLPAELAMALKASGLPRMLVPARHGGGETDPRAMFEALELLGAADGSTAWCAMVSATAGFAAAFVEPDAASELFGGGAVAGGVYAPIGSAQASGDRWLVTGRWPFASFSGHCDLLLGGARTDDGPRLMVFPAAAVELHDTWSVSGLCATGSNDMSVEELAIPRTHAASLTGAAVEEGPLYAFPVFGLLALGIAAVAGGIARAAIADLADLASTKTPGGSRRLLAERPMVQAQVARAEALVTSSRALALETIDRTWAAATRGEGVPVAERARLRLAATNATRSAAAAVDLMYEAGGGSSIYRRSPLQHRFRDVHAATQHAMVAPATLELAGRVLLGVETDASQL